MRVRTLSRLVLVASLTVSPRAATAVGPAAAGSAKLAQEMTDAELARMLQPLGDDAEPSRREAAKSVTLLGPDALPAMERKLAELRTATPGTVVAAIRTAREAAGSSTSDDLSEILLATKGDGAGYRTAVTTAVLLRALAHIGTTPAVRQLIRVAIDHKAALREEVARHVKALGDKAVAALIETRKEPSSELRHWAVAQLEGMGKRVPGDAVQTKDNQVLADVLRAYADVHDMDALPVLLSFVSSDRIQVRTAAREAIMQFGQDAIWKLREAYANVTGKPAPETWPASEVGKHLFLAYDRVRLQEVHELLDDGLAKQKEGKVEEAVAAFDKVLARQPLIERRGEMVPAYVARAHALEPGDPAKALATYRKALRLWPETSYAPQIEAEIAYLEGKELLARGVADVEPFKRALAHDPTHEKAREELARLEANVEERQGRIRALAAAAAVIVVALLGIILFGAPPRRLSTKKGAIRSG